MIVRSFLAIALLVVDADAVVLCAKARSNGAFSTTVKIREVCRPNETTLSPDALGLRGPQGPGLAIVDAVGKVVGPIVDFTTHPPTPNTDPVQAFRVVVTLEGRAVQLLVGSGSVHTWHNSSPYYYESTDCSGPSLVGTPEDVLTSEAPPLPFFQMLQASLSPDPNPGTTEGQIVVSASSRRTIRSGLTRTTADFCGPGSFFAFTPPDRCCYSYSSPQANTLVAEALQVDLGALQLTPPFHVESRP